MIKLWTIILRLYYIILRFIYMIFRSYEKILQYATLKHEKPMSNIKSMNAYE